ncbi:unnamed protein product, partial [Closterium sp. NIES-54]
MNDWSENGYWGALEARTQAALAVAQEWRDAANEALGKFEPLQLLVAALLAAVVAGKLAQVAGAVAAQIRLYGVSRLSRLLPGVRAYVEEQQAKARAQIAGGSSSSKERAQWRKRLPDVGAEADEVLGEMRALRDKDKAWQGRCSGTVYVGGESYEKHMKLISDAYTMIVPVSAHAAYDKAAEYFHVHLLRAPVADDWCVEVDAVQRLCSRNTVLIVASAPGFPHGIIDPIPVRTPFPPIDFFALSSAPAPFLPPAPLPLLPPPCPFSLPPAPSPLPRSPCQSSPFSLPSAPPPLLPRARSDGVEWWPVRVPHCLWQSLRGSHCWPFRFSTFPSAPSPLPPSPSLPHASPRGPCPWHAVTEWSGGLYVSPTVSGSRSGALIAGAWAAMRGIGMQGGWGGVWCGVTGAVWWRGRREQWCAGYEFLVGSVGVPGVCAVLFSLFHPSPRLPSPSLPSSLLLSPPFPSSLLLSSPLLSLSSFRKVTWIIYIDVLKSSVCSLCLSVSLPFPLSGYMDITKRLMEASKAIVAGVSRIKGLQVVGEPDMTVIAMTSDQLDIYRVNDAMTHRGWALSALHKPASIHLCVTLQHVGVVDAFLADLQAAVDE